MKKDFLALKEEIEKLAQNFAPIPRDVPVGPGGNVARPKIEHAIIQNRFQPGDSKTKPSSGGPSFSPGKVKEMQSQILDFGHLVSELGVKNFPQIGTKNQPDGGWGLKTNAALDFIRDHMTQMFPLLIELKKENLIMDPPIPQALEWFKQNVPVITKNVVPLTPAEKEERAGELTKAIKYFSSLMNQFKSLAQKGEFRNLINGTQTIARFPGQRQLIKAPGNVDQNDEIQTEVNAILKNDPNTLVPIKFQGNSGIPLKALTDPKEFFSFMEQKNFDQKAAKEILTKEIKPQAQSLKAV